MSPYLKKPLRTEAEALTSRNISNLKTSMLSAETVYLTAATQTSNGAARDAYNRAQNSIRAFRLALENIEDCIEAERKRRGR